MLSWPRLQDQRLLIHLACTYAIAVSKPMALAVKRSTIASMSASTIAAPIMSPSRDNRFDSLMSTLPTAAQSLTCQGWIMLLLHSRADEEAKLIGILPQVSDHHAELAVYLFGQHLDESDETFAVVQSNVVSLILCVRVVQVDRRRGQNHLLTVLACPLRLLCRLLARLAAELTNDQDTVVQLGFVPIDLDVVSQSQFRELVYSTCLGRVEALVNCSSTADGQL